AVSANTSSAAARMRPSFSLRLVPSGRSVPLAGRDRGRFAMLGSSPLSAKLDRLVRFCLGSMKPREANPRVGRIARRGCHDMAESAPDIATGRLTPADYEANFADIDPPLDSRQALIESSRCYFCHDAPCIEACPTGIDIPGFIRRMATGNLKGAAIEILDENIMGGICARVCPTEILCERACVRNLAEDKPVNIGALQRHATDFLFDQKIQPYARGARTGKRVAVVGGGPSGLACAHRLAMLGHEVVVFEARDKLGGLNEYGIAAYKVPEDFAQREVEFLLAVGGITVEHNKALGHDVTLSSLRRDFDAIFLAFGLAGVNALGLEGEAMAGVEDAVAYIARLRQTPDRATLP